MNINIKRFSRSKVDKPDEPEAVKRPRGRPKKSTSIEPEAPPSPKPEPEPESIYEDDSVSEISEDNNINEDNDFLSDLNNVNFKEPPTKEELKEKEKIEKIEKEERKQREKENNKFLKTASRLDLDSLFKKAKQQSSITKPPKPQKSQYEDDSSLFDDKGTELLGRDKRMLLSKIQQYKSLFPDELGKFKIKKNCSTEDLKLYLSEMESIVDTSSVEQFLTDSILQCIKLTEGVSSYTKYDITGCADLLKANKQFHTLTKQMYIKYKVFEKVPPEYSLAVLVATTAYVCKNKNAKKKEIESFLCQPIQQQPKEEIV
jgi:hypothetical protein